MNKFREQARTNWMTRDHYSSYMSLRECVDMVIEKCIESGSETFFESIILEILMHPQFDLAKFESEAKLYRRV